MNPVLQQWAAARGYRVACGGMGALAEARRGLERLRESGELDGEFARKRLASFLYERSAESMPEPRAVIVVAMPRPAHRVVFETKSGDVETILPPTYAHYNQLFEEVRADLAAWAPALSGRLQVLRAPLKSVASRLGLVEYGRNNVTYIAGLGSYFQLLGYLTDVDLGLSDWQPHAPRLMAACETCRMCVSACPTDSIREERVLLHAESCTTYFSEELGEELPANAHCMSAHNLFGCLECQEICPVNRGLLEVVSSEVAFDEAETEAILAAPDGARLPAAIADKLGRLGLSEQALLPRNLRYLVSRPPV